MVKAFILTEKTFLRTSKLRVWLYSLVQCLIIKFLMMDRDRHYVQAGNTKGELITVPLTSCLTGLDQSVLQIKTQNVSCHTTDSNPVKQEVNSTVILPLSIPWLRNQKQHCQVTLFLQYPVGYNTATYLEQQLKILPTSSPPLSHSTSWTTWS